jgi:TonB-linked SusC/RagA family outer membrane protein
MKALFRLKSKTFKGINLGAKILMTMLVIFAAISLSKANYYSDNTITSIAIDISGKITDENGLGLIGASVVEKGTSNGTVTDIDGNYKISVADANAVLVISYVGYNTEEIVVGGRTTVDLQMTDDTKQLGEVVVIGYGTQRKKDLTGAVVRVDMEDKSKGGNVDIGQALQGLSAGVNVGVTTQAGGSPNIEVRGQNSLSGSQAPLIILDGIIFNGSIANINVSDVASIDVLKDASAAAVYGARASNGVIIITTKTGKSDKPTISFNAYTGVQDLSPTDATQQMNPDQFLNRLFDYAHQEQLYGWYNRYQERGGEDPNDPKPIRPTPTTPEDQAVFLRSPEEQENFLAGESIDWIDQTLRDRAMLQNYDLSVGGKTERTSYYLSGTYTQQEGLQVNDQFERTTLRANFSADITDWLNVGLNSAYSFRDYSGINARLDWALDASPWGDLRNAAGNFTDVVGEDGVIENPLTNTPAENDDLRENTFLTLKTKIKVPWIKGLAYEFNYSNTTDTRRMFEYYQSFTREGLNNVGRARRRNFHNTSWLTNHLVTYSTMIANTHKIDVTLLASRENQKFTTTDLESTGFDIESSGFNLPSLGINQIVNPGAAAEQNRIAYMARAIYSFKYKYLLTATIRRDGFSAFATNNKTAVFPSVSLAWVLSEEPFLKNANNIDFLKARASYGLNGNDGVPRFASFATVAVGSTVLGDQLVTQYRPNALGNPDLRWETTASLNFGIDFGLFNDRLSGNIDYYTSTTEDVIVQRNLPRATGFTNILTNVGEVENWGFEIGLNSVNVQTEDFTWRTNFAFSLNRNKLTRLLGGENDFDIGNSWFTGEPINSIFGYENQGVTYTEEEFFAGNTPENFFPGHFKITDITTSDGNGIYHPDDDRKILGYEDPNYRFGLGNNFSYKNFTLNVFINSIQGGNNFYLANPGNLIAGGQDFARRSNQTAVRPYWTPDRPTPNAPGIFWSQPISGPLLLDRSFVRIQDVSLTYNLGRGALESLGLGSASVYVSGKNLATFTEWTGWDPEVVSAEPDPVNGGTLNAVRALPRTILVGVNISF